MKTKLHIGYICAGCGEEHYAQPVCALWLLVQSLRTLMDPKVILDVGT